MYICLCNGYREADIREIAQKGAADVAEAYKALGHGPCCGRCLDSAQRILDEVRGDPA